MCAFFTRRYAPHSESTHRSVTRNLLTIATCYCNLRLYDGKYYAHCKNFKHGVQDLLFKEAKNRGVEQYKTLSLNDVVSTSELITMYRIITGACKQGTETFVKSLGKKLKNKYTVKEAIELTKGQYGSSNFKNFFGE